MLQVQRGPPVRKDLLVKPALPVRKDLLVLPVLRDPSVRPDLPVRKDLSARPGLQVLLAVCWAMQISTPLCLRTTLTPSPPVKMSASPRTVQTAAPA